MIDIFAVKIPEHIEVKTYQKLLELLPLTKRNRINRFMNPKDSYRSLVADLLIRFVISRELGIKNRDIIYTYNKYGKPFLKDHTDFHFNISHSGEWVVCAHGSAPVGIDIEKIRVIDLNLFSSFLSHEELKELNQISPELQLEFFFDIWTLKESFTKSLGLGLSLPLKQYSIKRINYKNISMKRNGRIQPCFFKQYNFLKNYKLSVCSKCKELTNNVIVKDFKDIIEGVKVVSFQI